MQPAGCQHVDLPGSMIAYRQSRSQCAVKCFRITSLAVEKSSHGPASKSTRASSQRAHAALVHMLAVLEEVEQLVAPREVVGEVEALGKIGRASCRERV